MKVIHLNQHLAAKGGVETYLLAALPLLKDHGIQSTWIYTEGNKDLWTDSKHFPATGKLKASHEDQKRLQSLIESSGADIVHIHNIQNVGLLEASVTIRPTIITNHDYRWICPANTFFFKGSREVCQKACGNMGCFGATLRKHCLTPRLNYAIPFYRRIQQMKTTHRLLSHTIAPSPIAAKRLINAGWDAQKISVLPYFCPLEVREQPRPIPSRPTISFIGRIAPNKGQLYFIRALGALPVEWQGIIAGDIDSSLAEHLQAQARKHNCAERLQLRPWATRQEVLKIMDESTVFVFPSLWQETLGIVALEALSRGVPVVATNIVGIGHWLKSQNCGKVVPSKDADAIAHAVLELSSDPEKLLGAGKAGIELIQKEFTSDHHIQQLVNLYQRIKEIE